MSLTLSTIIQVFCSLSLYKVIIFTLTLATAMCKIYGETVLTTLRLFVSKSMV